MHNCLFDLQYGLWASFKERIAQLSDQYFIDGIITLKDFLTLPNFGRKIVAQKARSSSIGTNAEP